MSAPRSPPVALAGPPGLVLPRTLVVARTQAGPTGEMRRRREHAHIHPDLGDEHLRRPPIHAGDRVQATHLLRKRGDDLGDVRTQRLDHFVELVEVGQQLTDEKGVMGRKRPARAWRNAGSFLRSLPRARSAKTSGSPVPRSKASSIARPETPRTSLATDANLMPASSSTFCSRLASRVCSWISALR